MTIGAQHRSDQGFWSDSFGDGSGANVTLSSLDVVQRKTQWHCCPSEFNVMLSRPGCGLKLRDGSIKSHRRCFPQPGLTR